MAIPIDVLRNLEKFSKGWFIVADLNVLFYDISFLRSYIVGDPTCQLLTPIAILNKIDAMCSADPHGAARATRQAIAQLEACSRHVRFDSDVEETQSDEDSGDDTDEILKCCQKTMSHGYHVVLITRSRGLHTLAEIRGVHVYDVQHIKRGFSRDHRDGRNITGGWHAHSPARHYHTYSCIRYTPGHRHAGGGGDRHSGGGGDRYAGGGGDRYAGGGGDRYAGGGGDRYSIGGGDRYAGGGGDRYAGGGGDRYAGGGGDRYAGGGGDRYAGGGGDRYSIGGGDRYAGGSGDRYAGGGGDRYGGGGGDRYGGGGVERRRHRYYGRHFSYTRN